MRGLALLLLATVACASGTTTKAGLLEPFAAEGVTAPTGTPRSFALVIGINDFEDPRFADLQYAEADARAVGAALMGYDGVTVLASRESTSRAHILAAVAELERQVTRPEDTVLVYVSTHGSLGRRPGHDLERFLVASDTRLDLVDATGIAVADLLAALDRLVSRRRAVVLATCHSGSGKSALSDPLSRALAGRKAAPAPLAEVSEAMIVVSAAAFGEEARESDELRHDVYTYYLLEGMRAGDRDGDGAITVGEAHDWARERTYVFTDGLQRPTAESDVLGVDPVVLTGRRARAGLPVLFSYAPSAEGVELRVDGRAKGTFPGGLAVEPGVRSIELRARATGETLYEGELTLGEGERADVASLLPPPWRLAVEARAGVLAPVSTRLLPALWQAGVEVDVSPGWRLPVWLGASARYLRADGSEDAALDVRVHGVDLGGHVMMDVWRSAALTVRSGADVGVVLAQRTRAGPTFMSDETLRGLRASGRVDVVWTLLAPLDVVLGVDAGVLWASLAGEVGPHPLVSGTLGLRFQR